MGQEGSVDEILMGLWKMDLARSLVWTIRGVPGSVGGGRWVDVPAERQIQKILMDMIK